MIKVPREITKRCSGKQKHGDCHYAHRSLIARIQYADWHGGPAPDLASQDTPINMNCQYILVIWQVIQKRLVTEYYRAVGGRSLENADLCNMDIQLSSDRGWQSGGDYQWGGDFHIKQQQLAHDG